ncbi:efflux RND transporter periplasmic adaptor subunit [Thiotrichales bacterium 19S3-7]|nr:efflux RND transporter periplasmic adaptor subunit [Thiotrichales bacterium 19S3-7]MCF6802436.1 efflux RND transporter periplasmic adaptor subunit [Thiotrichales bacterium 19S3-11]
MLLQNLIIPGLMMLSSLSFAMDSSDVSLSQMTASPESNNYPVVSSPTVAPAIKNSAYSIQPDKRQSSLKEGQVYAIIIPVHEADISSGVNATIEHIYYTPGESFKKGDKLLMFDCRNVEIDIKQAQAELHATETAYDSNKELDQLKSISKVEFEKSKTEYEKAKAEVESLEYQLSKCTIVAPYDGEVIAKHANENENVKIDDPLLSIVSIKDVEVQMFVPSVWLNWLKKGINFSLKLQEVSQPLDASVVKIAGRVDPASQSVVIYGQLKQMPDGILAGMSGVATFNQK